MTGVFNLLSIGVTVFAWLIFLRLLYVAGRGGFSGTPLVLRHAIATTGAGALVATIGTGANIYRLVTDAPIPIDLGMILGLAVILAGTLPAIYWYIVIGLE